jgi:hypothetical protein
MKTAVASIIIILVILGVIGAYYFGVHHALAPATSTSTSVVVTTSTTTTAANPSSGSYYTDVSTWQTSSQPQAGFSIAYPLDFAVDTNTNVTPTTDWRVNTQDLGVKVITITVPKTFEPQTNFVDATLTVGYSQNSKAVADCLVADPGDGPETGTSNATINGTNFTVFTSSDAGAGNIYKTTSYRAVHSGSCYAVEYTVHSAELGNFPPSYDLTQYSDSMIDAVLNRIVGTFRFI